MINIEGEMDASQAPRMKRKTSSGANEVNAAQIMHDAPQPKKQAMIHQLTGSLTRAQTDTAGELWQQACVAALTRLEDELGKVDNGRKPRVL